MCPIAVQNDFLNISLRCLALLCVAYFAGGGLDISIALNLFLNNFFNYQITSIEIRNDLDFQTF